MTRRERDAEVERIVRAFDRVNDLRAASRTNGPSLSAVAGMIEAAVRKVQQEKAR